MRPLGGGVEREFEPDHGAAALDTPARGQHVHELEAPTADAVAPRLRRTEAMPVVGDLYPQVRAATFDEELERLALAVADRVRGELGGQELRSRQGGGRDFAVKRVESPAHLPADQIGAWKLQREIGLVGGHRKRVHDILYVKTVSYLEFRELCWTNLLSSGRMSWTFLTNHAHVLLCIARDPGMRLRDIAEQVGITERAAQRIVGDLVEEGYVKRKRIGRRNEYGIQPDVPLRHPLQRDHVIGEIVAVLGT